MIVVEELMVQIDREPDLPLHYEASPLEAVVAAVGWPAGIAAIIGGIAIYAGAASVVSEAVSVLLVGLGVTLVMTLVRCRRYEVTIGKRMIELRLGPFRRTLPTGCVEEVSEQPASSWRRLYAPRELVLGLSVETRPLIVPTHDPVELCAALVGQGYKDATHSRAGEEKSEIRNPKYREGRAEIPNS
jgi:hypothetical protein